MDERDRVDGRAANEPLFVISVAASQLGVHPQTLRGYERQGLIDPARTPGGTRLYSRRDLERLRRIQTLTAEGLTLAGAARVLALEDRLARLERPGTALMRLEHASPPPIRWRPGGSGRRNPTPESSPKGMPHHGHGL